MRIFLTFIVLFFLALSANSQQIVTENGRAYRLYTVQKGEGLYRVAVNNNITQDELLKANPQLKETGLVEGAVLKIPLKENPQTAYHLHTVVAGETLYSIGRKYGVTADQILECNPSLNVNSLAIGSQVRIPTTDIPKEDENYYYHRIQAGETLYSLCVKYNILQERVIEINPHINWNALAIGQIIALPKGNQQKLIFIEHKVQKRETIYSITHQYDCTEAELKQWNKGLDTRNLQKDQVLRILSKKDMEMEKPQTASSKFLGDDSDNFTVPEYNYKQAGSPMLNIALMLPFDAQNELRQINALGQNEENSIYYFKSRRYIEFYEGVKMAVDSLTEAGANITLHVYDANNVKAVETALNTDLAKTFDLIIGPSHLDRMKIASAFANENAIPIVFPFTQIDSTILDNPYAFQASEIDTVIGAAVMRQMVRLSEGKRMIVLNDSKASRIDLWKKEYLKMLATEANIDYQELTYNVEDPEPFLNRLDSVNANTLVIPSTNEAKINSILASVAGVMDQKPKCKITLLGYGMWLTFQTIEAEVFHKLNTHIITSFGIDEKDKQALYTMNVYRKKYLAEPVAFTPYFQTLKNNSGFSQYGLWGYDVALKFIGARIALGEDFYKYINAYDPPLVQTNFHFRHVTNWGGAANTGLKIINFKPNNEITVAPVL